LAPAARGIDLLEGKVEIHGYVEEQIRTISDDLNAHLDLTQWYNVLNIEMDFNIAPQGFGPFDSVTGYVGIEVRYDCVWTRACGISSSTNNFGNRSRALPERLSGAQNLGFGGTARNADAFYRQPGGRIETVQDYPANPYVTPQLAPLSVPFRGFNQVPAIDTLLGVRQVVNGVEYLPAFYTFERYLNYGIAFRSIRGGENLGGTQSMPWDPKDDIDPQSTLADRVNPFRAADVNPITGLRGGNALPYRQAPAYGPLGGPVDQAQGIFYPSPKYAQYLREGGSDDFQQNFSQSELEWNYGASQQQTKILKEAYLDLNLLGGALFLRLGRQTIVWGKTELFATTDQFNPNDLALASLPKLEESRIPIWAARAIYSFYEVGPFSDVRFEMAVDLDNFYPDDLGRCGEAYTPNPVCDKTYGLLAHGIAGLGVAGEDRPPHWWNSAQGLQAGARLEFRWDRFSFALVDFYNYEKIPYSARLTTFSRNVDPDSGRPRRMGATGPCQDGDEPSCLQAGDDALANTSLNQQYFAFVCAASVGFNPNLDPSVCAQSVLNSDFPILGPLGTVTELLGLVYSGSLFGGQLLSNPQFLGGAISVPLVALSKDPGDGDGSGVYGNGGIVGPGAPFVIPQAVGSQVTNNFHSAAQTIAQVLTPQQQALLGCGPFYGTNCDSQKTPDGSPGFGGLDLLNAEASALVQSWGGFDGGPQEGFRTDTGRQPGTVGFDGGPVCTRYESGQQIVIAGCVPARLPNGSINPAWQATQKPDGSNINGPDPVTTSIGVPAGVGGVAPQTSPTWGGKLNPSLQGHPFTGATWQSEMAAFSWNLQMLFVGLSDALTTSQQDGYQPIPGRDPQASFDFRTPEAAYRVGGCSFVQPQFCSNIAAVWAIIGATRNSINAGGNGRFGRRDFVWAGGGDVVLSYQRRNVLGLSTDFSEDFTKSNWGVELTWVNRQSFSDASEFDNISKTGTYNLTVSVDRPTFINFLNQSRTFFFNSQWFFQYVPGYKNSFSTNGPWNVLFTLTMQTGYFQDRLLPGITWVYDVKSNSGAALPELQYRITESFSMTLGFALFWGRYQSKQYPINPLSLDNQVGRGAYTNWVDNGISVVRQRDEVFFNLRYTF
jgi:hypothetical protein